MTTFPPDLIWNAGRHYLYLSAFADRAKIGVTLSPAIRIGALKRQVPGFEWVRFRLLPTAQAQNLENLISRTFGETTGTKGRFSEWFDASHVDDALRMFDDEELARATPTWRVRKRQLARA